MFSTKQPDWQYTIWSSEKYCDLSFINSISELILIVQENFKFQYGAFTK